MALRPDDDFLLVVDRPDDEMFVWVPTWKWCAFVFLASRPWLMKWWFGKPLGRVLRKWNADAFVSLEGPIATDMPPTFPK